MKTSQEKAKAPARAQKRPCGDRLGFSHAGQDSQMKS